jgi:hypothetical protein
MLYENLVWFCLLWLCVLIARRLWHTTHPPVAVAVPSPKRKTPRPLKPTSASSVEPRTLHDCPVCGRPHSTSLIGNTRKPGVLLWSERKSTRGKPQTICTAGYACPRPECDYFGNSDDS